MATNGVAGHVAEIANKGWTVLEDAIDPSLVEALAGSFSQVRVGDP